MCSRLCGATSDPLLSLYSGEKAGSAPGFQLSQQAQADSRGWHATSAKYLANKTKFPSLRQRLCSTGGVREVHQMERTPTTRLRKSLSARHVPQRGPKPSHFGENRPPNKLLMQIYFTAAWFPFPFAGLRLLPINTIYQTQNIVRKKGTPALNKTWRRFSLN